MSAITITFGDCAENNVGMQKIGKPARPGLGFSYEDLAAAAARFEAAGCHCELVDLILAGGVGGEGPDPGYVLVVRAGIKALLGDPGAADAMRDEQRAFPADTKALFRGVVKNKLARHNLCFADEGQEPDYAAGRGRVVAFSDAPYTAAARKALCSFFGAKAEGLFAEGNYYYRPAACGIGFHGDGERRKVIALRLGVAAPLHYQWFLRSQPVGFRVIFNLNHGDLYAMSEKAVGHDWKRSSILTLRHAAGSQKYLTVVGHPMRTAPAEPPAEPPIINDADLSDLLAEVLGDEPNE